MFPSRFRISQRATESLKALKGRTGVTPNILCRIAFVLSLRDGSRGGDQDFELNGSEFNTPTLFGEYALVYECLMRQVHGSLETKDMQRVVAGHIEAGLEHLKRVRSLGELLSFAPASPAVSNTRAPASA
jgi:DNA sulfur modification protein DndE